MRRPPQDVAGFRRRLRQLIEEHCDGKYTHLARRAGLAVSTLEHYLHQAKGLPGGAHLLRLAAALEVSAEYLRTGRSDGPLPPRIGGGGERHQRRAHAAQSGQAVVEEQSQAERRTHAS